MMEDSAREDLAVIRRIMEETRRDVVDRGKHFLIWGGITTIGLVLTHLAIVGGLAWKPGWVWVGLVGAGWVASMVVGWRDGRDTRVRTLGRRLLSGIWVATGITLTVIGMAGIFAEPVPVRILPGTLAVVIAPAVLVTGQLTGDRWWSAIAAGWWLGGIVMLLLPGPYTLLVMAGMALALMVVPGALLFVRARRPRAPLDSVGDPA